MGTPEGQVLIVKANHPERLDPALTRPGRIDYRLIFDLATKKQAAGIFQRLSAATRGEAERQTELNMLAAVFASKIPKGLISPAELQDFLLHRHDEPEKAVEEVDVWVQERPAAREVREDKTIEADESKAKPEPSEEGDNGEGGGEEDRCQCHKSDSGKDPNSAVTA